MKVVGARTSYHPLLVSLTLFVALPTTDLPLRSAGQVKTFHLKLIEMFQCSLHCSGEGGRIRRPEEREILEENRGKR